MALAQRSFSATCRRLFAALEPLWQQQQRQQQQMRAVAAVHSAASVDAPPGCPFRRLRAPKAATATDSSAPTDAVKAYESIPAPKGLPVLGTLWDLVRSGAMTRLHLYCDRRHRELGPIYRERLGVVEGVFIADSQLIQHVYQNEGKYPQHLVPEPWIIYNNTMGNQRGLFFMDGPLWSERRRSLNRVLLRKDSVTDNAEIFSQIVNDVLERWRAISAPTTVLPDLEKELYKWSIESLGTMIFGRRMGCITEDGAQDIHAFVHCVQQIFLESANMTMIPPKLAYALKLPVWRRFAKAVGKALDIARGHVETTVQEIVSKAERGEAVDGIMAQLLLNDKIGEDELVRIVTDLFVAAADTTSHATQWALYLLAKHQHWQEQILGEIRQAVPDGGPVTVEHLAELPLVKAVVKEALRLYPVAPFLTRILSEDITLNGYHIPAGKLLLVSLYTTGRDPKYFSDPHEFNPGRWVRKEREVVGTHACLPFGLGVRSCIGRRVAEVQMYLLLAGVVQNFKLEVANSRDVDIKLRMITTPSEDIRLRLTPYRNN